MWHVCIGGLRFLRFMDAPLEPEAIVNEGVIPVTGQYIPERDFALLVVLYSIGRLHAEAMPSHWERMKAVLQERIENPDAPLTVIE